MAHARYKRLVDTLAADIRSGRLPPGARLPTHRKLAAAEGLALVTATRVYAELEAMGLVSGETGRGTFVRETALPRGLGVDQHASAAGVVDLAFNYPSLPEQAELLRGALRQLASSGDLDALLRYQPHGGRWHERASVARHLARRGLSVDALTYPGFKVVADAQHLELAPLPASGQGPDPDALERLCRTRRVRAVYTMPTLHNPLGWVTSAHRRRRLVAIARRHGLLIIEDGAYAFLADDPPEPIAALAPEATVYVSGLSKNVATGLRVGFVAAPEPWAPAIERAIRGTTWNTPGVMTAIACGWLDDGTVERLEADKRRDAAARQAIASEAFAGLRCIRHPASYFVWLPLADDARADRVAMTLMRERVAVSTAEPFATSAHAPHAIRVALGSVDPPTLRDALGKVRRAIDAHSY
ncbi:PLP-dependent aminotransferase family protein [Burkholderia pseudomallei]|uniref:aminotransferase-like domain-containing protein n=1 Tax=Burkholderia pseudomallei TaxID=28450 RepID=UPI0006AD82CE|nr:PLP-dependent aminotransferase family protein [Burkholderia pseudomallei]ALB96068.1 GntR family transcriptional regulator [Burkholderia pseudomallei]ALC02126.1 GntR family transcriptional regulator [Burkholderia pseudomallei]